MKTNKYCPICNKPINSSFVPFCSKRCQLIDLGSWLTDGYAIPEETLSSPIDHDHNSKGEIV